MLRLLVPLCVVAALVLTVNSSAAQPPNCDAQVNDTAAKLLPCITQDDLTGYMNDFWNIAVANPGPNGHPSRNSGEPRYRASVDYVADLMRHWGYDVTIQQYTFPYFAYKSIPTLSEVSPTPQSFVLGAGQDWTAGQSIGTTTATVQPVGGIVIPPSATPSSASGCTSGGFAGFTAGNIALIQRGTCNFGVKIQNAEDAHASGVIVFNEGQPGRTDAIGINITDADGNRFVPAIPVAATTFAIGRQLFDDYQAGTKPVMSLKIDAIYDPNRPDWNVIADSKGGDKNHVVVVDAHLDAIYGAGMLDYASGSATILDLARMMKNVNSTNHLRFIWFGGEELGLLGSTYYVSTLRPTDLSHIGCDLDADVTATPNYTLGILDPAGPDLFGGTSSTQFPNRVYIQRVADRTRRRGRLPDLAGVQPRVLLARGHGRVRVQPRRDPRQRRAHRSRLLQDPGGGEPLRRPHGDLRRRRARWLRRQTVPLVRQPRQQRLRRDDARLEGLLRARGAESQAFGATTTTRGCDLLCSEPAC